jgi:hypothetical protein
VLLQGIRADSVLACGFEGIQFKYEDKKKKNFLHHF